MNTDIHFLSYLTQFFLECKIFQTKIVERIKTHFVFNNFCKYCAVYALMWENIVDPGRPQMTIWPTHIACWIPKSKNMLSEYVTLIDFPLQQWLHERASVLCYTGIAILVICTEAWNRKPVQIIQTFWVCTYRSLECYSRNHTRGTLPMSQNPLYTNNVQ
jgi:hypothetical protein